MKNFTSFADAGDYQALLNKALEIKADPFGYQHVGRNKTVGLIFHQGGVQPGCPGLGA
jgi:N-succinyl-L-ornithine transcarbamylase